MPRRPAPNLRTCVPCLPHFAAALLAGVILVTGPGCKESTGPSSADIGLTVVAGGGQTDTALARLSQALIIQLRDSSGRIVAGETVRLQSVPGDSLCPSSVWVAGLASTSFGPLLAESTDASGEVAVLLQLDAVAGRGRIAVSAPRFGYQDTVSFTTLPAAPTQVVVGPRDTALYVGHTFSVRGYVADAYGNRRSDPVTYQSLDTGTTVSPSGQATGAFIGRSSMQVKATASSIAGTVHVSVVPQGTIAAVAGSFVAYPTNAVVAVNLDGSGVAVIPQSAGDNNYLQWSPGGSSLLLFRPASGGHLYTISLSGTTTQLVQGAAFAEDNWARYAAGGTYVYFRGARSFAGPGYIWRIRPNGTGLDSVPVGAGTQPAPSPDGTRVAYVASNGGLHVYDYGAHTDLDLGIGGWAPHWSPDGVWIAFAAGMDGAISVVKPDGTGQRLLTPSGYYDWSFDWSPDSQWVVAFDPRRGVIDLVQVPTGLALPLPFTEGLWQPTWKP